MRHNNTYLLCRSSAISRIFHPRERFDETAPLLGGIIRYSLANEKQIGAFIFLTKYPNIICIIHIVNTGGNILKVVILFIFTHVPLALMLNCKTVNAVISMYIFWHKLIARAFLASHIFVVEFIIELKIWINIKRSFCLNYRFNSASKRQRFGESIVLLPRRFIVVVVFCLVCFCISDDNKFTTKKWISFCFFGVFHHVLALQAPIIVLL